MKYRISKNKRKYSPTPIVRVDVVDGKEKERNVLFSNLKKKEGDAFLENIVEFLNLKETNTEAFKRGFSEGWSDGHEAGVNEYN